MRAWPAELTHPPLPAFPLFWGRGGLGMGGGGRLLKAFNLRKKKKSRSVHSSTPWSFYPEP